MRVTRLFCADCYNEIARDSQVRLCGGCAHRRKTEPGARPDDWVNTDKFVAWLDDRIGLEVVRAQHPNWARALYRWIHDDVQVSIQNADELLIELGSHLSRLPDDFYEPRRPFFIASDAQRDQYAKLREGGLSIRAASEEAGVRYSSALKWEQNQRQAVAA